jgi:hypothetical protein
MLFDPSRRVARLRAGRFRLRPCSESKYLAVKVRSTGQDHSSRQRRSETALSGNRLTGVVIVAPLGKKHRSAAHHTSNIAKEDEPEAPARGPGHKPEAPARGPGHKPEARERERGRGDTGPKRQRYCLLMKRETEGAGKVWSAPILRRLQFFSSACVSATHNKRPKRRRIGALQTRSGSVNDQGSVRIPGWPRAAAISRWTAGSTARVAAGRRSAGGTQDRPHRYEGPPIITTIPATTARRQQDHSQRQEGKQGSGSHWHLSLFPGRRLASAGRHPSVGHPLCNTGDSGKKSWQG